MITQSGVFYHVITQSGVFYHVITQSGVFYHVITQSGVFSRSRLVHQNIKAYVWSQVLQILWTFGATP